MHGRNSYPLALIFIVVSVCAVMIGCLVNGLPSNLAAAEIFAAAMGTGMGCAILGFVLGFHQQRRAVGAVRGAAAAMLTGVLAGPLLLGEWSALRHVFAIQVIGSLVLLGTVTWLWASRKDSM